MLNAQNKFMFYNTADLWCFQTQLLLQKVIYAHLSQLLVLFCCWGFRSGYDKLGHCSRVTSVPTSWVATNTWQLCADMRPMSKAGNTNSRSRWTYVITILLCLCRNWSLKRTALLYLLHFLENKTIKIMTHLHAWKKKKKKEIKIIFLTI